MLAFRIALYASLLLATLVCVAPARAGPSCHGVGSLGYALAGLKASDGTETLDLSADGALVSLGAGCDLALAGVLVGGFADVALGKVKTSGATAGTSLDRQISAGLRLGYLVQPTTLLYVKGGYALGQLAVADADTSRVAGPLAGAGLETLVAGNIWFRFDYQANFYGAKTVADALAQVKLEPTVHLVRAGLVMKFGE